MGKSKSESGRPRHPQFYLSNRILSATAMSAPDSPLHISPRQVLERFFEAERRYMQAAGSFEELRATLADDVMLHQSPDLPWGGEYVGSERYEEWARAMSAVFDRVDMQNPRFFEQGDTVVIMGTLVTRVRATGETMELPMAQMVRVKAGKIIEFRPFYWNVPAYVAASRKSAP